VSDKQAGPTFERFRDGWVVVDRSGTIATPTPMTETAARAFAAALRLPFPSRQVDRPPAPDPPGPEVVIPPSIAEAGLIYLTFVQELAENTDAWQRIRTEHVPTPEGFCGARGCGRGGYGTPHLTWPCSIRSLADWAHLAHEAQQDRSKPGQAPGTP
jgi:hypothetical protein